MDLKDYVMANSYKEGAEILTDEYLPGLRFRLRYLDKFERDKLVEESRDTTYERGIPRVELKPEKYIRCLSKLIIGWVGMSRDHFAKLVMCYPDGLPEEIPWTPENAELLLSRDQSGLEMFIGAQSRDLDKVKEEALAAQKKT